MSRQKRASVGTALEGPTHAANIASGFGTGQRKPESGRVRKQTSPQTAASDSSAPIERTAKITFKMPQSRLDDFEELYEKFRAEERAKKRRLTKVAFAGLVFEHGLKEEPLRRAIHATA